MLRGIIRKYLSKYISWTLKNSLFSCSFILRYGGGSTTPPSFAVIAFQYFELNLSKDTTPPSFHSRISLGESPRPLPPLIDERGGVTTPSPPPLIDQKGGVVPLLSLYLLEIFYHYIVRSFSILSGLSFFRPRSRFLVDNTQMAD